MDDTMLLLWKAAQRPTTAAKLPSDNASAHHSVAAPTKRHWCALKQVSRYLRGTAKLDLQYIPEPRRVSAERDADFLACTDTRQSTYSMVVYYAGNPIA